MRAGEEPLSEADRARLDKHGLKSASLSGFDGQPLPQWLIKWAALVRQKAKSASRRSRALENGSHLRADESS
eukprot:597263-Prorocentrum_minimum.AAC.1